ncbi:MAG TPA: DNA-binding protein [Cyanobacteria bacterium UBA8803]|nr:DNA-binding protein [Cyanobacteria bacterium UBA9273]HBL57222.1 DNA-binding protein [Cyanobacteria bacterium UBA8803]
MQILALRLNPDEDLKTGLRDFVNQYTIQAGFILTAVGSLKRATLRFASQDDSQVLAERFEIVSLVGTLSIHSLHLHIALSDRNGQTIGGHVLDGCIIYTTAEIVIGVSDDLVFLRTLDQKTGYKELDIRRV